uniref:Uncharacterized protein n=2 Tax=Thermococcus aciditolerans TaxID=2598455 RepID=A0A5C0SII8_9EURY|nr:hypothetical protein FPV09_01690 [Thermococcus aciditolerans]
MKWYDEKTPDRLFVLTVEVVAFTLLFSAIMGDIGTKLFGTGVFLLILTFFVFIDADGRDMAMYLVLPVGLMVSGFIMTIDYQDLQTAYNYLREFFSEYYPVMLWLFMATVVTIVLERRVKSKPSSR